MDASAQLKEAFYRLEFTVFDPKTKQLKTNWFPLKSPRTGRILTEYEINVNKPNNCSYEIYIDKFRFCRTI